MTDAKIVARFRGDVVSIEVLPDDDIATAAEKPMELKKLFTLLSEAAEELATVTHGNGTDMNESAVYRWGRDNRLYRTRPGIDVSVFDNITQKWVVTAVVVARYTPHDGNAPVRTTPIQ